MAQRNNKTKYLRKHANRVSMKKRNTLKRRNQLKQKNPEIRKQKKVTFKTSPFFKPSNSSEYIYGKIYATWCGHCQVLEPEWKKVEESLYPHKSHNIESVESDQLISQFNSKYNTTLESKGYPTIFKLNKIGGSVEYYEGNRSHGEIVNWIKNQEMPQNENEENTNKNNWFF